MNRELSHRLLQTVMDWDLSKTETELPLLSFMANMKYDSYDQYMPGTRFMASLVQWLECFEPEEREIMYNLIRHELVFISSTQMSYLVDLLYNSHIKPALYNKVADSTDKTIYKIPKAEREKLFEKHKRRALIMGLSDGAHTDVLRRSASFSNEQVLTFYYPSGDKIDEMLNDLNDVSEDGDPKKFTSLYLIDDFTASGTSFIRFIDSEDKFKGKLSKILEQFDHEHVKDKGINDLMCDETIDLHVCFCIATDNARKYIETMLKKFLEEKKLSNRFRINIDVVQVLGDSLSLDTEKHQDILQIVSDEKYVCRAQVSTTSFTIGKHERPYLGFNEGALPLVLAHNTPNNSLLVLWQYNDNDKNDVKFKGLFPRISRH